MQGPTPAATSEPEPPADTTPAPPPVELVRAAPSADNAASADAAAPADTVASAELRAPADTVASVELPAPADTVAPAPAIELAGQHRVHIRRGDAQDTVELVGRDGKVVFAIEVSERGPVLRFEGPGLTVRAAGDLSLEAESLNLRAEKALTLQTGGDLRIEAAGDLHSSARVQHIRADLGDVAIEANDDVRIDGERVLVNC